MRTSDFNLGPHVEYKSFKFHEKKLSISDFDHSTYDHGATEGQKYAIGELLTKYSSMVGCVRRWQIPQTMELEDRNGFFDYSVSYSISYRMQDVDCFNLIIELCIRTASRNDKHYRDEYTKQFKELRKMLENVCQLRNVVAHAEWLESIEGHWYPRRVSHNKITTENDYVVNRLSEDDLREAIEYIDYVNESLNYAVYEYAI